MSKPASYFQIIRIADLIDMGLWSYSRRYFAPGAAQRFCAARAIASARALAGVTPNAAGVRFEVALPPCAIIG